MNRTIQNLLLGAIAVLLLCLHSPKWTFAPAAWLSAIPLLVLFRSNRLWVGVVWVFLISFIAGIISQPGVMPFPLPVLLSIIGIGSLISLLPFIADHYLYPRSNGFWRTLLFPSTALIIEFSQLNSLSGVWGSIANTQHDFLPLAQTASLVGIWGIVFLVYWFAPVVLFVAERWREERSQAMQAGFLFLLVLSAGLIYGGIRLWQYPLSQKDSVKVAAITLDNTSLLQSAYEAVHNTTIAIHREMTPLSPEMQALNEAFAQYLEDPDQPRFQMVSREIDRINRQALSQSKEATEAGAQVLVWSEGLGMAFKKNEKRLIQQAQQLAKEEQVYLLLAMKAFLEAPFSAGEPVLENKVLTIAPNGTVINTFFKNRPVPYLESSAPGDGHIPIIQTEFGQIAPSISYDADFPLLIAQTGRQEADLLLIPTDDWHTIAPYHSYMTRFRAIENGVSVVKSTSRGLSIAYDPLGRIIAEQDFSSAPSGQIMITDVPAQRAPVLYPFIGDSFAWFWSAYLMVAMTLSVGRYLIRWLKQRGLRRR
jgi:apolipoprotein N-acyltransferase